MTIWSRDITGVATLKMTVSCLLGYPPSAIETAHTFLLLEGWQGLSFVAADAACASQGPQTVLS